ncbi:MAG: hypothetical protein ACI4OT_05125 [Bacilli bacterium]
MKNKEKVFLASICKVEKNGSKYQGIFLSDVYLKKDADDYVNYFNNDEKYTNAFFEEGDIFVDVYDCLKMNDDEVFKHMLYNPNYCKDRLDQINKLFEKRCFSISKADYEKCLEVKDNDADIRVRYEYFINDAKVKVKKI